ncbi:MAG TPA: ketol-acid reductoisomerase [Caulobacteraceae bacterium]
MDVFYERDADVSLIRSQRVAVVGYGSQGRTHALNLRDSGVAAIRVALKPDSATILQARADGFEVVGTAAAAAWAEVLVLAAPDEVQPSLYDKEIGPHLRAGATLVFIHGLAINFGLIRPAAGIDVILANPKGAGAVIRSIFERGGGVFGLFAVHQDASGRAWDTALAYGAALGCGRTGMIRTTFRDECECDLFGEQAVLCGGVPELIRAAWETLVEAGYPPEVAWFETLHEAKLVTDLIFQHGIAGMYRKVSNTAEFGAYLTGPRVIGAPAREAMREALAAVRDGGFVARLMADEARGQTELARLRAEAAAHPSESVDARMHAVMESSER